MDGYIISERTACSLVGLSRAAYRYMPLPRDDEEPLRAEVIRMASTYGRCGYRFIASMMHNDGWGQATRQGSSHLAARGSEDPTKANS